MIRQALVSWNFLKGVSYPIFVSIDRFWHFTEHRRRSGASRLPDPTCANFMLMSFSLVAGILYLSGSICLERAEMNPLSQPVLLLAVLVFVGLAAVVLAVAMLAILYRRNRVATNPSSNPCDKRQEFADALPHVLWGTDAAGRCEFLNDRYTETFGIPRSKAIRDQNWAGPIHPADRNKMYTAWRNAVENGSSYYTAHARVRMSDSSYRWMESVGRSVRSPATGEVLKWYGSLIDVQSQVDDRETIAKLQFDLQAISDECERRLGETDEMIRAAFESRELGWLEYEFNSVRPLLESFRLGGTSDVRGYLANDSANLAELRKHLSVCGVSQRMLETMGYATITDLVSGWSRNEQERNIDVEIAILTALLDKTSTTCGIARLEDAKGMTRVFPFTVWITDQGIAKAAFFDTILSVERAAGAGDARSRLARANRVVAASALEASVIHQISQPITAISLDVATAARLAASEHSGLEAMGRVIDRLRSNAQRLAEISTKTRESIKAGREGHEPVNLVDLAKRSCELLVDPLNAERGYISVSAAENIPDVMGDRGALQQAILALLQNALDTKDANGRPAEVSVAITFLPGSEEVRISVSDQGPGIAPEHLPLVFDPFFTTKPNHLGFGLTVCQRVIEDFAGTLTLSDRPCGGTVAEFSIPLTRETQADVRVRKSLPKEGS